MSELPHRRAVFLDRDGTIIEDADYLSRVEQVQLLPAAAAAIKRLNDAGWYVVVVTNQSGVARGLFPESQIQVVHDHLAALLGSARVDAWYYCPHLGDACDCRKPRPGMLLRAAREYGIDLKQSWMIGDKLDDVQAGVAADCKAIQVRTGKGAETGAAADLAAAVELILATSAP
ncbi:D-glycero-beta-D-manno-heptose 1,7-bisphosphate 7-phosphatase [soil metagenome]